MKKPARKGGHRSGKPLRHKPRFSRELALVYEDDAVVAVNKPAGLLAVPVEGSATPSALSLLIDEVREQRRRVYIVHRIDRFTSGALLFAKTHSDRQELVRQFLSHTPIREYVTVVRGHLEVKEGTLVHYFRKEGMFQELSSERDSKAARAELRYRVERSLKSASVVRVWLGTGLQNQIRVQFSALGHPVIGDRKYHPAEATESRIARVALHAARLQFVHPRTGENISIACELPSDFQALIKSLQLPPRTRR